MIWLPKCKKSFPLFSRDRQLLTSESIYDRISKNTKMKNSSGHSQKILLGMVFAGYDYYTGSGPMAISHHN